MVHFFGGGSCCCYARLSQAIAELCYGFCARPCCCHARLSQAMPELAVHGARSRTMVNGFDLDLALNFIYIDIDMVVK